MSVKLLFSQYFNLNQEILDNYGALDICVSADLPFFIDPFLLFSSEKKEYQALHQKIVEHLIALKDIATSSSNLHTDHRLFQFPEIKQNWLGVAKYSNEGRGLGPKFAKNIIDAFNGFYSNFGSEDISESSHIEKLTLVGQGIGKDFISDFTTNLILEYLLQYTENFAIKHLSPEQTKKFSKRCVFNSMLKVWTPREFTLPYFYRENGDFIILTPMDILTKDEAFICHSDLKQNFRGIVRSLENSSLRDAINTYFQSILPANPKSEDIEIAVNKTIKKYPETLDYYIKYKEDTREEASRIAAKKIDDLITHLMQPLQKLNAIVHQSESFSSIDFNSYEGCLKRALFLKEVIENNDGYRIFYHDGKPIAHEDAIQRIFRLTWYASPFDVNSEVNNGRGPADYKVSMGSGDSTIVEFKLGKSSSLKANLLKQTDTYKKASKSPRDIKVILCYADNEIRKVKKILKSINQEGAENIIIIDASPKISASKVR